MRRKIFWTAATLVVMLAATSTAQAYLKYKLEGESFIDGNKLYLHVYSPSKEPVLFLPEVGDEVTCAFTQADSLDMTSLLLPAVQRRVGGGRDYRTRSQFTLNFEEIDPKGNKVASQRIRARAVGPLRCEPVPKSGAKEYNCIGTYSVRGKGGRTKIRGSIHHTFRGFFIDDIIIGVVPETMTWNLMGSCRTR